MACARLVDNFQMSLLPRLGARHEQLSRRRKRTRLAQSASVGELEAIVEEEVERICSWPRTHHRKDVRRACLRLVEDRSDELVRVVSTWARDGAYGMELGKAVATEVRPALCEAELRECTRLELEQLVAIDAGEDTELTRANQTGHTPQHPLRSERSTGHRGGVLMRVTAEDFHRVVVADHAEADVLIYLYFPGRTAVTDDTHARLRAKFIRLAEFLDAPGSNGSLAVGWMDCIFNQIPYPHGAHVHSDTIAIYPARSKGRPNYFLDLRGGDVDIHELVGFVFGASANQATKQHVAAREDLAGPRVMREGLMSGLLTFEQSLTVHEPALWPLDLDQLKDEL